MSPVGILFAITTGLLDIIPFITWLFTKAIKDVTQNVDFKNDFIDLKIIFTSPAAKNSLILLLLLLA